MKKKQTAMQELLSWVRKTLPMDLDFPQMIENKIEQALQMEREQMIDLVQSLKDYTLESKNVLGNDEREASEFVDIHYTQTFNQ